MQSYARYLLFAMISLSLLAQTLADEGEIDRLLGARVERNCFFSPMGCMFLPGKKLLSRVRRLPRRERTGTRRERTDSESWFWFF